MYKWLTARSRANHFYLNILNSINFLNYAPNFSFTALLLLTMPTNHPDRSLPYTTSRIYNT